MHQGSATGVVEKQIFKKLCWEFFLRNCWKKTRTEKISFSYDIFAGWDRVHVKGGVSRHLVYQSVAVKVNIKKVRKRKTFGHAHFTFSGDLCQVSRVPCCSDSTPPVVLTLGTKLGKGPLVEMFGTRSPGTKVG